MEEINLGLDQNNNENHNKKKVWIIIVSVLVIAFLIFGLVNLGSKEVNKKELEISGITMSVEYNQYLGYSAIIKGTAKNVSGKNLSYASVEFSVYDANGNNLGTAIDNINNLTNGDTWVFEANLFDFPNSKPVSYKLVDIVAW